MMQKIRTLKNIVNVIICFTLFIMIPLKVQANDDLRLMQCISTEDTLQLFVGGEMEIKEVTGQLARTAVEVTSMEKSTDIHTIILIDNSLSVVEINQKKIAAILEAYMSQKAPEEIISLATYGEDITYLVEREADSTKILEAAAGIVYQNQDSYLTDILYDEITKLNNKTEYTRFIIATDGMDDKAIGYTKDELTEKLKEENYPVYTLGCICNNNTTELENLFSISRLTNSNYFLLDDYDEYNDIVVGLNETVHKIVCEVPEEYRNGSEQSVLITLTTDNGSIELSDKISMPFQIEANEEPKEEEIVVEETVAEESVAEKTAAEETVTEETLQDGTDKTEAAEEEIDYITIGAVALIVILLIVVVVLNISKKKGKKEKVKKEKGKKEKGLPANNMYQNNGQAMPSNGRPMQFSGQPMPSNGRPMLPNGQPMSSNGRPMPPNGQPMFQYGRPMSPMGQPYAMGYEEEEKTVLLNNSIKTLMMKDINSGKVFSYPVSAEGVVIGRNRNDGAHIAINYSAQISRQHCRISSIGSRNFIEDLGSLNGVFINGQPVQGSSEFRNGDIIKLGDVEMEVSIN